jgi:type IV secretion system protein VirD4
MKRPVNNAVGPQIRGEPPSGKLIPLLGVTSLFLGLQAATQYFAYVFRYQEVLGSHIGHIYAPWSIIPWATKWHDNYSQEIMQAGSIGMLVSITGLLGVLVIKLVQAQQGKVNQYLHGSARWATREDIEAATLLPKKRSILDMIRGKKTELCGGVYVGGWQDKQGKLHYLRHNGPENVLTYAPTRSGKGVGQVIPTLLSWLHSVVIIDLKGELWALTAGWRKHHASNKVLRFEPASENGSVRWNPLDEIRLGTHNEVGDIQNLATLIVDPDGKGFVDHWQKTAFSLFSGVILHALYKAKHNGITATLPGVDSMLSDPNRDVRQLWNEMITYEHTDEGNHPTVGAAARDMLDRSEEEATSVLSTAKSYLALYRDPIVAQNVSSSDFRIKDLMHHDDPVSLYIITEPNDKTRLRPLIRVMINMIVRLLADKMEFKDGRPVAHYKHRLLLMLDEFPSLGKLEVLQESLAFVAGYGIKCFLICQDINQLKSRETGYGHDETITSNCHIQTAYPPNRIETAEHLSRLVGETTVIKEQITTSGARAGAMLSKVSRTQQEIRRSLLTPDECLRMPGPRKNARGDIEEAGDMVICVAGFPAIYGKQILYFKDPIFAARAAVEPPEATDTLRKAQRKEVIRL